MAAVLDVPRETPAGQFLQIEIGRIDTASNVRADLGDLTELAASIEQNGLLEPIHVHRAGDRYVVDVGHRRLAAASLAGNRFIAAIVDAPALNAGDAERTVVQLIENIQRADLNPIEEAKALRAILEASPKLTQASLAKRLGRSAPWVANTLGLLEAAEPIQAAVEAGALTAAHLKAFKGLAGPTQVAIAKQVVADGLSAHATEEAVRRHKANEDWRKEREANARRQAADTRAHLAAGVERATKRIPKDGLVYLHTWYNDSEIAALEKLLVAAGFTNVHRTGEFVGKRSESAGCDCVAWLLETGYGGTVIVHPACVVREHHEAKRDGDSAAFTRRNGLEARVRARLAEVLVDDVAAIAPRAARIALWIVLSWQIEDWTKGQEALLVNVFDEKPKRKKRDPWATLAETPDERLPAELAKALAKHLRDGNFKVGWEQLAAELGVLEAPIEPDPKP